ncbi:MAG: putative toxin-antitoxin system toxin component, PIN family [Ramlibacter sp.]|nr:putative toxin-antitoxin system toxin component, PIN family [Ramlibacter sp.]
MKPALRVVLDTNVVLSALVFGGGPAARVRSGWQSRRIVPLASSATVGELLRVLAYPKFKLTANAQEDLLADYLPYVQIVKIPNSPPIVPPCRDPFDLPFLHLAIAGKARALVSGDKDLLVLDGAPGLCRVFAVEAFCREVLGE